MSSKKTLVRGLPYAALIMAFGGLCTGCCWAITEGTWDRLGSEKADITNRYYEYTPDCGEIVFSGRKRTKHYVWPFLTTWDVSWNTYTPFEKRIPLNPVPENLIRLQLEAVADPAALRAHNILMGMPGENQFDNPVEVVRDGAVLDAKRLSSVRAGDTIRLHVHPDDLPLLSEPFAIRLAPDTDNYTMILLFPREQDGPRYEILTANDARSLAPFAEEFEDEAKQDNEAPIGPLGYCWKYFWLPSAAVTDILITTPCSWVVKGAAAVYLFGGLVRHGNEL